jgi:hypothetical protein
MRAEAWALPFVFDSPFFLPVRLSTISYLEPRFLTVCGMPLPYPASAGRNPFPVGLRGISFVGPPPGFMKTRLLQNSERRYDEALQY